MHPRQLEPSLLKAFFLNVASKESSVLIAMKKISKDGFKGIRDLKILLKIYNFMLFRLLAAPFSE